MEKFLKRLVIVIVLLLFAVVAYYAYDNLREKTEAELMAQIIHDEDRRELTERLKLSLQSENIHIRSRAALAVGRIGAEESGLLLFDMISDPSHDVASTAAFALGLTSEKGHASKLMDIVNDVPSNVTYRIVEAAGRLADSTMTGVIDQLFELLSHPSPSVREAVCMALFRANAKERASELITFMNQESDELVRVAALYTLARLGISEAKEIYVQYLADAEPFIRSLALRGLSRSDSKESEHYLAIALNDSDPGVVAQAIGGLASHDSKEAKQQIVKKFEQTDQPNLVAALIRAMQQQKSKAGAEMVRERVNSFSSLESIGAAIQFLASYESDRAVDLIDSLATTDQPYLRARCADGYGLIRKGSIIPRVALLFSDEDSMVRQAALSALLTLDTTNEEFYLNKALNDPDYVVVSTAVDHIGQKKRSSFLPVLLTMMSRGAEIDVDIRRSILDAARPFLVEPEPDKTALEILVEGALDPVYVIRLTAAEIYKDLFKRDSRGAVSVAQTRISVGTIEDELDKKKISRYARVITEKGEIEIELFFDVAPLTVLNFMTLAKDGFYDGLSFHRVVPNFVVQGGDPRGDGWGGPDYMIRCEYSTEPYRRGTVGIATSGKDTGGSQFFITLSPQPHLEGRYTVFGQVIAGMQFADEIVYGDLIEKIIIEEEIL